MNEILSAIDWAEVTSTILTLVIIPAIIILGKRLGVLIDEKVDDSNLQKYLKLATDCITDSVGDVAQTYVDKLNEDEWNDNTKACAFELAKEKVLTNLGITGKEVLEKALGDFDGWLKTKIESEVQKLNNNKVQMLAAESSSISAIGFNLNREDT